MEEIKVNKLVIDVLYNEKNKHFEVWSEDQLNQVKSLMMSLSHDDVIQQLKETMVKTLEAMVGSPIPVNAQ